MRGLFFWLRRHAASTIDGLMRDFFVLERHFTVRGFLVPMQTTGIERWAIGPKLSFRASESAAMRFNDVRLGDDTLLARATIRSRGESVRAHCAIGWRARRVLQKRSPLGVTCPRCPS